MIAFEALRKLALSFPETTEEPHSEKISFRVNNKIFATYDGKNQRACIKLSPTDQYVFSLSDRTNIYAVANKWGTQGWTFIELKDVNKQIFVDALISAYCEVAPKKLAQLVKAKDENE